jgi:hypothetical protein
MLREVCGRCGERERSYKASEDELALRTPGKLGNRAIGQSGNRAISGSWRFSVNIKAAGGI